MKIWLDDFRPAHDSSWTVCTTVEEAIFFLETEEVTHISFDHDLGEGKLTGYDLACHLETLAYGKKLKRMITWDVHSANPVGAKRINETMTNVYKYMILDRKGIL